MRKTITQYVIVKTGEDANYVARLLDEGYTLVISWVVENAAHHILSKDNSPTTDTTLLEEEK